MSDQPVPKVVIANVKDVTPANGAVKLKVEAIVSGKRSEIEIAIATDLAPKVALALLATTQEARAQRDDLPAALEPLAMAVVPSEDPDKVRLQLLFDKGSVLPVEVPKPAAQALSVALGAELKGIPNAPTVTLPRK